MIYTFEPKGDGINITRCKIQPTRIDKNLTSNSRIQQHLCNVLLISLVTTRKQILFTKPPIKAVILAIEYHIKFPWKMKSNHINNNKFKEIAKNAYNILMFTM